MNARNAPWIVALFTIASLSAGCAFGQRHTPRGSRCEVPCTTSLRIEATAPAVFTVTCGGER